MADQKKPKMAPSYTQTMQTVVTPKKPSSGTTEGTDQESAERNLRQEFENLRKDQATEKERKDTGYKKGGSVKSASARADGIAMRGKTRGKMY